EGGNAREIAERFHLSRPFVANILKELCHRGYVASHRGVKGGYALRPPAEHATLAELLDAVGEGFRLTLCSAPSHPEVPCSLEAECPVKAPLADVHRRIIGVLRGVTLAELFTAPTGNHPAVVPLGLLPVPPVSAAREHEPAALTLTE
ncbi:MAG: RrF2 family transcriptional regulator, partial [Fimbriiglobus sp.]